MDYDTQSKTKFTLQRHLKSEEIDFIAAGRQECDATHSCGPSARPYEMLHFVKKGKVHFYFGGQHYLVKAGQLFYAPAFSSTFYHADSVDPCTYAWLNFTGKSAKDIIKSFGLSNMCPVLTITNVDTIWNLIGDLLHCYTPTLNNDLAIRGFMLLILAQVGVQTAGIQQISEDASSDNELVQHAIAYVLEHSDEELNVQKVADSLFISRGYLHQLFNKYLHTTPQQFIINAKIQQSSEMLIKTTQSIKQISELCGYKNQFAFSRAFTREMSISPSEYRRRYSSPNHLLTE